MLPHALRRLPGCSYEGARTYFVTILTRQRRRHFVRPEVVTLATSEVQRAAVQTRFEIVAACYMPDHLHLVVEGRTTSASLLQFIKKAKQFSAYYVKKRFGIVLWAHGYATIASFAKTSTSHDTSPTSATTRSRRSL